ncbi:MAG: TetR/AcrR family transcriptional regulator [Sphingomonadaceae bacterium]
MRITKEKAEENRQSLVKAAGKLFREKGIDGVGVAEISKEAGLTHGALYAHFPSKEALAAAAFDEGMEQARARAGRMVVDGKLDLDAFLDYYLSTEQRDSPAHGCAMAASASEIGRQDTALSAGYSSAFQRMARVFERHLATLRPAADARADSLTIAAALIGGVASARATAKADPALSDEILAATRRTINHLCNQT